MAHEFKAGDLALVVGSNNQDSPNLGMSVELIGYCRYGDMVEHPNGSTCRYVGNGGWLAFAEGLLMAAIFSDGSRAWEDRGGTSFIDQRHLIPLRGEFEPEQQKTKEAEPCA